MRHDPALAEQLPAAHRADRRRRQRELQDLITTILARVGAALIPAGLAAAAVAAALVPGRYLIVLIWRAVS